MTIPSLYPEIEPYNKGRLQVSDIHQLYWEESGNSTGIPVVFLHGGPGGGTSPRDRRFFDPSAYRIVMFDQRGAGRSTPSASLVQNTTWDLVEDIEKLRKYLKINKWLVFGGSWGSTLALAYAEINPTRVSALVLRGIFTLRSEEIKWLYQYGAHFIFPDMWEKYEAPIPENERDDFVTAYYKLLTGDNEEERLNAAMAWTTWECSISRLKVDQTHIKNGIRDEWALKFARIECHYFFNKGFFKSENQIIENATIIADHEIPTTIIHGRYDVVCPVKNAWDLKKKIPYADIHIVEDCGHSPDETGIAEKLITATNYYIEKLTNQKFNNE